VKERTASRGVKLVLAAIALIVVVLGGFSWFFSSLAARQHRDMAAVKDYVARVQPQLAADPRFQEVQLLGYSASYIRHPYIPVLGRVSSQQDWDALDRFIRESKPPVFISVRTVFVETNREPEKTK
jgi:hypothetical protein